MSTTRLTVAQAVVRFLEAQHVERDGVETPFFAGCWGIFGHGNVAGVGQALLEAGDEMPYVLARNEQAMVHAASGYARQKNRLSTYACTASVGPGSTNMVTGAALATINRLPVLLLPGDIFATRVANPVLQELEDPTSLDVSVNDTFKPVSRFWDRINRPEQLISSALAAMRVLTDPVETGAATVSIPQDVQAEAHDWPESLFAERTWHIARPLPERSVIARAAEIIRSAHTPLIVAGGGVVYSGATETLAAFCNKTGIPVGMSQAGKGALPYGRQLGQVKLLSTAELRSTFYHFALRKHRFGLGAALWVDASRVTARWAVRAASRAGRWRACRWAAACASCGAPRWCVYVSRWAE